MRNREKIIEDSIKKDIERVFCTILKKNKYTLSLSTSSRNGADISAFLEKEFVKYTDSKKVKSISNSQASPKENTKSPFDFCFEYTKGLFKDTIWGDIKAVNISYQDSNPDMGTPEKLLKFILDKHFYILYVLVYYESTSNKIVFKKKNNRYVHCFLLKDCNRSIRINSKPQFQININQEDEYRTIDEFIELFYTKYKESIDRNIKIQQNKKKLLQKRFIEIKKNIEEYKLKFK